MAIHPITTTNRIRNAYINYLKTIKPFDDQELRFEFAQALEQNKLTNGPIIEVSPPFKTGKSIRGLVDEGILSPGFEQLCSDHLPYTRPLYLHQEKAIRKLVGGRNIVVATGTGSGKTETFLIPIFHYLLKERQRGTLRFPGVRALLLYPMNALANDQMKRLRRVLRRFPEITFGRYTGETAESPQDAQEAFERNFPGEPDIPNELKSRMEMKDAPPHILLTNYAMLEYLLLRPEDSSLFDGETGKFWRFIALDEAHVYNGASATEIAMLLRRLQERVTNGHPERLQAIATSATLGRGENDFPEVVEFARGLFNVPFEWEINDPARQDVVLAERIPLSNLGDIWGHGDLSIYRELDDLAEKWRQADDDERKNAINWIRPLSFSNIPHDVQMQAKEAAGRAFEFCVPVYLYHLLKGDGNIRKIRAELSEIGPTQLQNLADRLFDHNTDLIVHLVSIAILARPREEDASLLPARYHLFVRALEGAFVCLNTEATEHQGPNAKPRLFLQRQKFCPHCGGRVFELANCTRCGTAYIIGNIVFGHNISENSHHEILPTAEYLIQNSDLYGEVAERVSYFVLESNITRWNEDEFLISDAEDEEIRSAEDLEPMRLCPECGAIYSEFKHKACHCSARLVPIHHINLKKKKTLRRCVHCSTHSSGGIVFRFLTGQDAPVSILADTLYQDVPTARDDARRDKPGGGRKMLNFTDSRQNAAFFASYLERAHERNSRRQLVMRTIQTASRHADTPLRLEDLHLRLLSEAERAGFFTAKQSIDERRRLAAIWLMLEFAPLDRRISLEGVGLLRIRPVPLDHNALPPCLLEAPWNLSQVQAYALIQLLLDTLRRNRVITYLMPDADLVKDEAFAPRRKPFFIRKQKSKNYREFGIYGWMPADNNYSNARLEILKKYLKRQNLPESDVDVIARRTLNDLWDYLTHRNSPWADYFVLEQKRKDGTVFRLDHRMWELIPTQDEEDLEDWYICDRCQNVTSVNFGGICPIYGCEGQLRPLESRRDVIEGNFYRRFYLEGAPIPMRVEEHTAQWVTQKAAEIQNAFIRGEVNFLSCSTTFELGVDVGDLQVVLLRNVPPTTANYVQRAGRAGRRTDSAAFVVTYAQRRSHDLTYFTQPEKMVAGEIRPPVVILSNEKIIRRHLHSAVFSAFFRWAKEVKGIRYKTVGDFFVPEDNEPGPKLLKEFLGQRPEPLQRTLDVILPHGEIRREIQFPGWDWVQVLTNDDGAGVLDRATQEVQGEVKTFRELVQDALANSQEALASGQIEQIEKLMNQVKYYSRVEKNIRSRHLLGFLGTRNVLPKYGFPTDVVELSTSHLSMKEASQISLQRDLRIALSEFAPGGEVVAAKRLWRSVGVKKLPGREWTPYEYAICPSCKRFNFAAGEGKLSQHCQLCGAPLSNKKNAKRVIFIVPEQGFIAGETTRTPGDRPPQRIYAGRVHFADYQLPEALKKEGLSADVAKPEKMLDLEFGAIQVWKRYSRFGWLALVNTGMLSGFRICSTCGFAEPIAFNDKKPRTHKNPMTGRDCKGSFVWRHLGHRFMTDVLEISLTGIVMHTENEKLSFLYAILDGASEALGIQRNDINGTYYHTGEGRPAFILFDEVPGGAGHVKRIYDHLRPTFETALARVDRCECGLDTSCYNCLRNYQNQYFHDLLQRGLAISTLKTILQV